LNLDSLKDFLRFGEGQGSLLLLFNRGDILSNLKERDLGSASDLSKAPFLSDRCIFTRKGKNGVSLQDPLKI
jgi:hypothetical protein